MQTKKLSQLLQPKADNIKLLASSKKRNPENKTENINKTDNNIKAVGDYLLQTGAAELLFFF